MKKTIIILFAVFMQINLFANVSDMLENALPSVVTVSIKKLADDELATGFGYAGDASEVAYNRHLELTDSYSSGSGFVIKEDGKYYVITNSHVIEEAADALGAIAVISITQTEYSVKIVGSDSFYDIAVLEFVDEPSDEITFINFSEKDVRIGEKVYAIGNSLGEFPYTVTDGIISGKNRVLDGTTGKYGYLQSTASIIWGNSGGPLLNETGDVVGINSRIQFEDLGDDGVVISQINFALESKVAQRAVDDIISHGKVQRTYCGIVLAQGFMYQEFSAPKKLTNRPIIFGLIKGSPAEIFFSGKDGAEILEINGTEIRNIEEALGVFEEIEPEAKIKIKIKHNEKVETITLETSVMNDENLENMAVSFLNDFFDMKVKEVDSEIFFEKADTDNASDKELKGLNYKSRYNPKGKFRQDKTKIDALGWGSELWRIQTIKDVAVALRLSIFYGGFDYRTGETINEVKLMEDEDISLKVLIY